MAAKQYAPRRPDGLFAYVHDSADGERLVYAADIHQAWAAHGSYVRRAWPFDVDRLAA